MWRSAALTLSLWLGLQLSATPAGAQQNTLVGTWSYSQSGTQQGSGFSIFFQFLPDGTFRQRMFVSGSQVEYLGQYQLGPNVLQLVYRDYQPKQDCRYGACYPIPPQVQMGQVYNDPIQFQGPTRFLLFEGQSPKLFVRNQ